MKAEKINEYKYKIPTTFKEGMKIEGIIYADENLINIMEQDKTLEQIANVATLPGFINYSLAMPDAHQGYGFCIGGVAASDSEQGLVSAGGVGYDINCGIRLLTTPFREKEMRLQLKELVETLFKTVPTGASTRSDGKIKLSAEELDKVLINGAKWTVENNYATEEDIEFIEDYGKMEVADVRTVSGKAILRGKDQLGTLGSGNHFLEIQVVDEIYDNEVASRFGIYEGQITVMIHTGSRGLGHQVCTDYLEVMDKYIRDNEIALVDRQLSCVPINSKEGRDYLSAMAASANFAFANRQCITQWTREAFEKVLGSKDLKLVYDLGHNIAKFEEHKINDSLKQVLVHRKGATRAFGKGNKLVSTKYRLY